MPWPPNCHRRPIAAGSDPPLPARLPAAGAHLLLPPTRRRWPTSFWRLTATAVRLQPPPTFRGRASAAAARLSLPPTCLLLSSAGHREALPSHLLPRLVSPTAITRTHYRPASGARPHLRVSLAHGRGMAPVLSARTIAAAGAYGLRGGGGGASDTVKSAGDAGRCDLSLAETLLSRGLDAIHRRPHHHAVGHRFFGGSAGTPTFAHHTTATDVAIGGPVLGAPRRLPHTTPSVVALGGALEAPHHDLPHQGVGVVAANCTQ